MVAALKEKNRPRLSAIRMLKAAIKNAEIKRQKQLFDEEIVTVVMTEIKKRNEAIVLYTQGGRPERAAEEKEEIMYLEDYLPRQMAEEELTKAVQDAISSVGAVSAKDMGKVMAIVMPAVKGRATGDAVSRIVKSLL